MKKILCTTWLASNVLFGVGDVCAMDREIESVFSAMKDNLSQIEAVIEQAEKGNRLTDGKKTLIKAILTPVKNTAKADESLLKEIREICESNEPALHLACQNGCLSAVMDLIEKQHANVDGIDEQGKTPLVFASNVGRIDIVRYLVEKCGAQVTGDIIDDTKDSYIRKYLNCVHNETSRLLNALMHGDIESWLRDSKNFYIFKQLLHSRPLALNFVLMVASEKGCLDIVKYLVEECHCDVESKDKNGRTPLCFASSWGHLDTVKYLIEKCGAHINADIINCVQDEYINEYLSRVYAEISRLLNALRGGDIGSWLMDSKKFYIFKQLLHSRPLELDFALMVASKKGYLDVVRYLTKECYCNVESRDDIGRTPLLLASQEGHLDIVKYLVEECHCNVESKYNDGQTPLHWASCWGRLDTVKYLVEECHCNVESKDNDGQTPLHLASNWGRLDTVKYLIEECHCNIESKDNMGETPLHLASRFGGGDIVKYLVEECHCNVESKDHIGWTPLHEASLGGHLSIVKYLIEKCNANVESKNNDGQTALYWASQVAALKNCLDIVKYFVEKCKARITDDMIEVAKDDKIKGYLRSKK